METLTIDDVNQGKTRLEFGNPDHIELVKESEIEASKKKFKVKFTICDNFEIEVNAIDEEKAEEIANDRLKLDDFSIYVDITEIE